MAGSHREAPAQRVGAGEMSALWRSPADRHWHREGEPCEVLAREDGPDGIRYRVRFADGEEMWVEAEELDLNGSLGEHPSVAAAQRGFDGKGFEGT